MEFPKRQVKVEDFDRIYEFCYEGVRSAKDKDVARREFELLLQAPFTASTVLYTDQSDGILSIAMGAFLREGYLDAKLTKLRVPDLQARLAGEIKRGNMPFADENEIAWNNAHEGSDFLGLYLGFSSQDESLKREVERKTFEYFSLGWSGFNIRRVVGEIWSSDHMSTASQLLFQPYNEYEAFRQRRGLESAPRLMGLTHEMAQFIASHNIVAGRLFSYQRPSYDLQPATKEVFRFLLNIPPSRSFSPVRVRNEIFDTAKEILEERPDSDLGKELNSRRARARTILLDYFADHISELRPFPTAPRRRPLVRGRKE